MTALYMIAFLAIPLVVVGLLLAFDRIVSRVTRPHRIWWFLALTQVVAIAVRISERDFGVPFWLHALAIPLAVAGALYERSRAMRAQRVQAAVPRATPGRSDRAAPVRCR